MGTVRCFFFGDRFAHEAEGRKIAKGTMGLRTEFSNVVGCSEGTRQRETIPFRAIRLWQDFSFERVDVVTVRKCG